MKHAITCILKKDGNSEKVVLEIGKQQKPEVVIGGLIRLRNQTRANGEPLLMLVRISRRVSLTYSHDWVWLGNGTYKCVDCGVRGRKPHALGKVQPIKTEPKYQTCKWKLK